MRSGDRVRFGEMHGTLLSHFHKTAPFKPKDQWLVQFDDDHQQWVDTSRLSKIRQQKRGFSLDPVREMTCTSGHDMAYWGGIGATCRRCGRVEIDGEFYGYDETKPRTCANPQRGMMPTGSVMPTEEG